MPSAFAGAGFKAASPGKAQPIQPPSQGTPYGQGGNYDAWKQNAGISGAPNLRQMKDYIAQSKQARKPPQYAATQQGAQQGGYGSYIGKAGPQWADFRDSDNDNTDDRWQAGPGQASQQFQEAVPGPPGPVTFEGVRDFPPRYPAQPQTPPPSWSNFADGPMFRAGWIGPDGRLVVDPTRSGKPLGFQDRYPARNPNAGQGQPTKAMNARPATAWFDTGFSYNPATGQAGHNNMGNAANSATNRAPAFNTSMTDQYGMPTTQEQYWPQQQAFMQSMIDRLGQAQAGTYLGAGAPPPSFGAMPQMDFPALWSQAGDMVQRPMSEQDWLAGKEQRRYERDRMFTPYSYGSYQEYVNSFQPGQSPFGRR